MASTPPPESLVLTSPPPSAHQVPSPAGVSRPTQRITAPLAGSTALPTTIGPRAQSPTLSYPLPSSPSSYPQTPTRPIPRAPCTAAGGRRQLVCRPRGDAGVWPMGFGVRRHVGSGGRPRGVPATELRLGDPGSARLALCPWPRTHPPRPGELLWGGGLPVGLPWATWRRLLWPQGGRWCDMLR